MLTDNQLDEIKKVAQDAAAERVAELVASKLDTQNLREVVERVVSDRLNSFQGKIDNLGQEVSRLTGVLDRLDDTINRVNRRQDDQEAKFLDFREKSLNSFGALSDAALKADTRAMTVYQAIYGDPSDPLQGSLRQLMVDTKASMEAQFAAQFARLETLSHRVDTHEAFIDKRRKVEGFVLGNAKRVVKIVGENTLLRWTVIVIGGAVLGLGGFDVLSQLFNR